VTSGEKTNLLFFTKGRPTRKIWYYDLSGLKIRKKTPLMLKHFEDFLRLLPTRGDSALSWTVDMDARKQAAAKAREIEDAVYDLKAVNPHKKAEVDERTPEQLLEIIAAKGREVAEALAALRNVNTAAGAETGC
jgi:type I restriction enzyme M protein